ncbi:hypothetical protein PoB_004731000 [Plakobranchus ocellatus]|uniref:Secreted protein n=1 Tax=Plakobranchus ocellatus TaxID=259542 RepID=A0AAV4BNY4_9GAST|nr:hypothetical protein PoB_004731000 [Plakobranchus ocellatus]
MVFKPFPTWDIVILCLMCGLLGRFSQVHGCLLLMEIEIRQKTSFCRHPALLVNNKILLDCFYIVQCTQAWLGRFITIIMNTSYFESLKLAPGYMTVFCGGSEDLGPDCQEIPCYCLHSPQCPCLMHGLEAPARFYSGDSKGGSARTVRPVADFRPFNRLAPLLCEPVRYGASGVR